MNAQNIRKLIDKAKAIELNISVEQIAHYLGVTSRTIAQWEKQNVRLSPIHADGVMQVFYRLLMKKSKKYIDKMFRDIPSEMVSIWFAKRERMEIHLPDKLICLPESTRIQTIPEKYLQRKMEIPLGSDSLTTYPLKWNGKDLLLTGDEISNSPYKRYPGHRVSSMFKDGLCHSLIHCGHFKENKDGKIPVFVLVLENKMELKKKKDGDRWEIIKANKSSQIYTKEDLKRVQTYVKKIGKDITEDMHLMGMLKVE